MRSVLSRALASGQPQAEHGDSHWRDSSHVLRATYDRPADTPQSRPTHTAQHPASHRRLKQRGSRREDRIARRTWENRGWSLMVA